MHRRTWGAKLNATIVIQGLQGRPIAEICNEYQMSQSLSYQWRDQSLAPAPQAFEVHQHSRQEARLGHEHSTLKKRVGELRRE